MDENINGGQMVALQHAQPALSRVVRENIQALAQREVNGTAEHGDNMDRTDYAASQWAAEWNSEHLDAANYSRKLMHILPRLEAAAAFLARIGFAWDGVDWRPPAAQEAICRLDSCSPVPRIEWFKHWGDLPEGMLLYAAPVLAAPAVEALKRIKLRLHFIEMPGESMWNPTGNCWVPDWRYEIQLIESVLHGSPITAVEGPTDTRKRVELPSMQGIDLVALRQIADDLSHSAKVDDYEPQQIAFIESIRDRLRVEIEARQNGAAFDMAAHLQRQREWSERTFGPGARAAGIVDHIRKELLEIQADPGDLREWIDVAILALDGAWRSGATPRQIIAALVAKQVKNEGRIWPDWRTMSADKAIEHDRSGENRIGDAAAPVAAAQEAVDFYVCDACACYYMVDGVICDCFGGSPPTCALRHVRMAPVAAAPNSELHALLTNSTPLREAAFRALGFIDRETSGGEESYRHLQKALHDECDSTPPAPGIDRTELRARVVSAIQRITSGAAPMRVPADMTDPDLVLGDVLTLLDSLGPQIDASPEGGSDALLREVRDELEADGVRACIGSMSPMENLHGRIAAHLESQQATSAEVGA